MSAYQAACLRRRINVKIEELYMKEFWLPDAEILNLKEFETLNVLSKLEGLWLNRHQILREKYLSN